MSDSVFLTWSSLHPPIMQAQRGQPGVGVRVCVRARACVRVHVIRSDVFSSTWYGCVMALGLSHVCLFHVNALMRKVALHRSPTERKVPPGCRVVTSRVCRTQVHPQTSPGSLGVRELEGAMLDLRVHTHTLIHTHSRSCTLVQAHSHMLTRVHTLHIHTHVRTLSHSHAHVCTQTLTHLCTHTQFHTCVCSCRCTPPAQSHTCRSTRDDPCCWRQRLYS